MIIQQRIIEKMNEYMSRRDYAGAERHLLYWLGEAEYSRDLRGQLLVRNELIGQYRKTAEKEKAFQSIDEALRLLDVLDFHETTAAGTTYVNAGTACNAFGDDRRALELFGRARAVYESSENTDPQLLAGLYNNLGLTYAALGRYAEAGSLYRKAVETLSSVPDGYLETAITYLNMADAAAAEKGAVAAEKEIAELLEAALVLLEKDPARQDGYYAFVLEKCAPSFSYYGYFAAADRLSRRAETIYEHI